MEKGKEQKEEGKPQEKVKGIINYGDFQKLDLRIGRIEKAEKVPGADRLLKLEVSIGQERRSLVAGIALQYPPEDLPGKQVVVLANMEPKTIRGVESQGMVLAATAEGGPILLQPEKKAPEGAEVK